MDREYAREEFFWPCKTRYRIIIIIISIIVWTKLFDGVRPYVHLPHSAFIFFRRRRPLCFGCILMHLRHLWLPGVPQIYRTQMPGIPSYIEVHWLRFSFLFSCEWGGHCRLPSVDTKITCMEINSYISQHGKYVIIVLREHKNNKWETIARYLWESFIA